MPFKPGQSGNPGGRPRLSPKWIDYRERLRAFMNQEGWAALEELAMTKGARDRHRALETLAAYAFGRPTQYIAGEPDPEVPPVQVTVVFDKPDTDQV